MDGDGQANATERDVLIEINQKIGVDEEYYMDFINNLDKLRPDMWY